MGGAGKLNCRSCTATWLPYFIIGGEPTLPPHLKGFYE